MEQTVFYKYPEQLMRATGYISPKTGELVQLTANDKNVYMVMKKRNTFFDKHFDKQEDLAIICGVSLKQMGRILRKFIEEGVIVAHKGMYNEHKNYRYEKVVDIQMYLLYSDGKLEELPKVPTDFWGSISKPNKEIKHEPSPNLSVRQDWDESGIPF